jgi:cell division septation protein DedD
MGSLASCKSKQSAYKEAYGDAKEKEVVTAVVNEGEDEYAIPSVSKSKTYEETSRQERITPVTEEDAMRMKLFSVVIGSFVNKTNAASLKELMEKEGYRPLLGENERGMLRVILTSHESYQEAAQSREAIRSKYYPKYQDAWILELQYE